MSELKFCQSCGMLLDSKEVLGTNQDDSINEDYCVYCFKDGDFTTECTMEEMIEVSVKHMQESGILTAQGKTAEEAREFMHGFFPKLKRWSKS